MLPEMHILKERSREGENAECSGDGGEYLKMIIFVVLDDEKSL